MAICSLSHVCGCFYTAYCEYNGTNGVHAVKFARHLKNVSAERFWKHFFIPGLSGSPCPQQFLPLSVVMWFYDVCECVVFSNNTVGNNTRVPHLSLSKLISGETDTSCAHMFQDVFDWLGALDSSVELLLASCVRHSNTTRLPVTPSQNNLSRSKDNSIHPSDSMQRSNKNFGAARGPFRQHFYDCVEVPQVLALLDLMAVKACY